MAEGVQAMVSDLFSVYVFSTFYLEFYCRQNRKPGELSSLVVTATSTSHSATPCPASNSPFPDNEVLLSTTFPSNNSNGLLQEVLVLVILVVISLSLIISGDIETNPGPLSSERPTYDQLLHLKEANLKVIKWISSLEQWQCTDFAHMLLKDRVVVSKYEKNSKDEFVRKVLDDWLSRNDDNTTKGTDSAVPRTWSALAECITDADLPGALTKAINDACPPPPPPPPARKNKPRSTCSSTKSSSTYSLRKRRTADVVDNGLTSKKRDAEEDESEEENSEEDEVTEEDNSEEDKAMSDEEFEEDSTASSEISDWIQSDREISFISSSRKRRKPQRQEYSDESSEGTESSSLDDEDEAEPVKKKTRTRPSPADYRPSDWLKSNKPRLSPYLPQVGDIVVYFYQGHQLYRDAVLRKKAYPWKPQRMPWEKFTLRPQEFCQVRNVHFVVGPPTLCSITLELRQVPISDAPCSSQQAMAVRHFTFKFHDMDNVLDFIILEQVYKESLKRQWSSGDRFQSQIGDEYYSGKILRKKPFTDEIPDSKWQSYHVKWDDGVIEKLSPWDLHPTNTVPSRLEDLSSWDCTEKERILNGLCAILENQDEVEEAQMFLHPVNLEEEIMYCTVVPYPTCISTIEERLRNGFYRQKIALIWEVVLLARNALAYNEETSLIVKHGKIFVQMVLKFIRNSSFSNVTECRHPDLSAAEKLFSVPVDTNSSPVKSKNQERNNSQQVNGQKDDVIFGRRLTRSSTTSRSSFMKLDKSFEEEEGDEEEEEDEEDEEVIEVETDSDEDSD